MNGNILPKGEGFSSDRRDAEIMRAEHGLPPADSLDCMFSSDRLAVIRARIIYGTEPVIEDAAGPKVLPKGEGFSSDRRDAEIMRAMRGLPPAESLKGMFISDILAVQRARFRYGIINR